MRDLFYRIDVPVRTAAAMRARMATVQAEAVYP
jgi:hypothetical protein